MNTPQPIETSGGCICFRPVGKVSLSEAIGMVAEVIRSARTQKIPKLLVNLLGLTGFPSPTLAERYFLARVWAKEAQGSVRTVVVVPPEMIDPEKFGVMVARNAGMDAEVFATEAEAMIWLKGEPGS